MCAQPLLFLSLQAIPQPLFTFSLLSLTASRRAKHPDTSWEMGLPAGSWRLIAFPCCLCGGGGGVSAKVGTGEGCGCRPRGKHCGVLDRGMNVWLVSSGCLHVVHHPVLQIKSGCHLGLDFSFAGHCSGKYIPNSTLLLGKK